jgi:CBS domain-containing protein
MKEFLMSRRTVREVMTTPVVTVTENTPFKELAAIMLGRGVSALPVLGRSGQVSGLVREADLLPKEEVKEDPRARRLPRWRRWMRRAKASGVTAREVMTSPAPRIGLDASVVAAAREMDRSGAGHLLVARSGGELAGIVSRSDVMSVFLRADEDIRDEIVREVFTRYLATNPALVRVKVAEGVVTLSGEVENKTMIPVAVRMSESVDGVVAVNSGLTFAVDDTLGQRAAHPATY